MTEIKPGISTCQMANFRYFVRLFLWLVTLCLVAAIVQYGFETTTVIGLVTCLLALYGLDRLVIPKIDKLIFREKQALRGAEAEETVGAILNRFSQNHHRVFHDVPKKHGNIDHLVFRADGAIFLIETKSQGGTVTFLNGELHRNGRPFDKDFIKQTLNNVSWLKKFCERHSGFKPTWVHAAIVFTDAQVPPHCKLFNVDVIHQSYLERWMARLPGNVLTARKLWPQMDKLEAPLRAAPKEVRNSRPAPHRVGVAAGLAS
jgi:hypothetical protein